MNEIVKLETLDAVTLFNGKNDLMLKDILSKIEEEAMSFVPILHTAQGRKDIASMAAKVSRSKVFIDGLGKKRVDELKELPKQIDNHRKYARDFLDNLRDKVRQPLTDFENAEKERIARHESKINEINMLGSTSNQFGVSLEQLTANLEAVQAVNTEEFQEFNAVAEKTKQETIDIITECIERKRAEIAKQEELERLQKIEAERLQKEREEQIAREARERAEREAEIKIQRERERAEREKAERIEAEKRAEQARLEAIRETEEKARIESERIERERAEREKDESNRKAKKSSALFDLMENGINKETAIKVIELITENKISNISINF